MVNEEAFNSESFINRFLEFEEENDFHEWVEDGVPIWGMLRFHIYSKLIDQFVPQKRGISDLKTRKIFNAFFRFIFLKRKRRLRNIPEDSQFLIFNHPRRKKQEGYYEDIYTDTIIDHLDCSLAVIERYFDLGHLAPSKTKDLYFFDEIEFPSRFADSLNTTKLTKSDLSQIEKLSGSLKRFYNLELPSLNKDYLRVKLRYKYVYPRLRKLIQRINPKCILIVVGYDFYSSIICKIGKDLAIPVVELQHGIISPVHIGYNYPQHKRIQTFPDYFLSWGSAWSENVKFPLGCEVLSTGFPYIDKFASGAESRNRNSLGVLVISQMRQDLGAFVYDLAKLLPNHDFMFKLHPGEYSTGAGSYRYLLKLKNVKIIEDDRTPLYDLFSENQYLLGIYSTALIEGLAFGLDVIIAKFSGWDVMLQLSNIENFSFYSSPEEIAKHIISASNNGFYKRLAYKSDFFRSGSLEQIKLFIDDKIGTQES